MNQESQKRLQVSKTYRLLDMPSYNAVDIRIRKEEMPTFICSCIAKIFP